jgi:ketosteroid isomerase-like protein
MRYASFALLASLWLMVSPVGAQSSNSAAIQSQLKPLMDEQAAAANAHDTDRFLKTYLHSPQTVFIVNGETVLGFDALHEQQLKWWKGGKSDVVYRETGHTEFAVLDRNAALTTQFLSARGTGLDGKPRDNHGVLTSLWRRTPDGWKVTYAHESWSH